MSSAEQVVGTIVGAVIGFFAGGPAGAVQGAAIGYGIGQGMTVTELDAVEGPRNTDLQVQTSQYGSFIPRVYGDFIITGNVFWVKGNAIKEVKHTETIEQGGKGGGSEQDQTTYTYQTTLAIGICEGEVTGIRRIWADEVLIYDFTSASILPAVASLKSSGSVNIFKGSESQLPSGAIEAEKGVGNVPAFRGMCYVVFNDFQLEEYGNRIPNFRFEVSDNTETTGSTLNFASFTVDANIGNTELPAGTPVGSPIAVAQVRPWYYDNGSLAFIRSQDTGSPNGSGFTATYNDPTNPFPFPETTLTRVPYNYFTRKPLDNLTTHRGIERFDSHPWDMPGGIYSQTVKECSTIDNAPGIFLMHTASLEEFGTIPGVFISYISVCMRSGGGQIRAYRLRPMVNTVSGLPFGLHSVKASYKGGMLYLSGHESTPIFDGIDAAVYVSDISHLKPNLEPGYSNGDGFSSLAYRGDIVDVKPFAPYTSGNQYALGVDPYSTSIYVMDLMTELLYKVDERLSVTNTYDVSGLLSDPDYTSIPSARFGVRGDLLYVIHNKISDGLAHIRKWLVAGTVTESGTVATNAGGTDYFNQSIIDLSPDAFLAATTRPANVGGGSYPGGMFVFITPAVNSNEEMDNATQTTLPVLIGKEMGRIDALVSADYNTDGLSETDVRGYALTRLGAVSAGFKPLQQAFRFDMYEEDYQIKFRSRGTTSSRVTIPTSDLRAREPGQTPPPQAFHKFKSSNDIPGRMELEYVSLSRDNENGYAYADRLNIDRTAITKLNIPVVLSADEAYQTAEILLLDAERESKGTFEIVTHFKYSYLEKTDLITVVTDWATLTLRILEIEKGKPGIVKILAVDENVSDYSSTIVGEEGDGSTSTINIIPSSRITLMDLPAIRSTDDDPGIYWGLSADGDSDLWRGGSMYTSYDDGGAWTGVDTMLSEIEHGIATNELTTNDYTIFTWDQTLTAYMINGVPETKTEDQVRRGANLMAYGRNGAWEILKYQEVTSIGDDKYEFTGLLRGQYGTDWTMDHNPADIVVLIDRETTRRFSMTNDNYENAVSFLPLTLGRQFNKSQRVSFSSSAMAKLPHAPKHVKGNRDASSNLTISWIPRVRYGYEWANRVGSDITDVDVFEVDVMNGTTVLRTITSVSATHNVSYTASQQTTDFGSAQSSVTVRVYQQGNLLARGTYEQVTI